MDLGAIWSTFLANPSTQLALRLIGAYLLGLYAVTIFWTIRDAQQRVANPVLPYALGSLALVPYLGVLLYVIVRPRETLDQAYERRLAQQVLLAETERFQSCPSCSLRVDAEWLLCPICRTRLNRVCAGCGKVVRPEWDICPHCAKDFAVPDLALVSGTTHRSAS